MDHDTVIFLAQLIEAPCILCGRLTHNRGSFFPNDPKEFGIRVLPGKTNVIVYALCEDHPFNESTISEVEKRLAAPTN